MGWIFAGRQRTKHLRRQFGTEYDRLVRERGTKHEAENELEARRKRVESLDIHPLSAEESDRFIEEWQSIQTQFVDQPIAAVREADHLITEVM